jgi:hypothetical protein
MRISLVARRHRPGVSMVFAIVTMTAVCGLCSMGADYARVQLAKTELRRAADAASRAAAAVLASGVTATQNAAIAYGAYNTVDGTALTINGANDVEFGTWDGTAKTFTVLSGLARANANAVRVTARRTAATGNAIPLFFARVVGKTSCDVTAQSVALFTDTAGGRFVGLTGLTLGSTAVVNSYNANSGSPGGANLTSHAQLASNGPISLGSTTNLYGDVLKGPSANLTTGSSFYMSGNQLTAGTNLAYAATESPTAPSGGAVVMGSSQTMTLPGGNYNFSTATIGSGCTITATGPVTVYLTGGLTVGTNLTINAYQNKPTNFKLRLVGTGHAFTAGASLDITAEVYGPGWDLTFGDNTRVEGSIVTRRITGGRTVSLYYDTSLSNPSVTGTIATVR